MKQKMLYFAAMACILALGFVFTGCPDGGNNVVTTFTLSPTEVTIDNDNLTRQVTVGGNATGTVTLDYSALPQGITATVNNDVTPPVITITADAPPIGSGAYIDDDFEVIATRGGINAVLTVIVDLEHEPLTFTLSATEVTVDNDNLVLHVIIGGNATGTVTLNDTALPQGITATVNTYDGVERITIEGTRADFGGADIYGNYKITASRQGIERSLTVIANITPLLLDIIGTWDTLMEMFGLPMARFVFNEDGTFQSYAIDFGPPPELTPSFSGSFTVYASYVEINVSGDTDTLDIIDNDTLEWGGGMEFIRQQD